MALWNRGTANSEISRLDGLGSRVWCNVGQFIRDDGSGTLTSSAGAGIYKIPHIFRHFTQLVCGEASGNFTTGSSTFGSVDDAITGLDGWDSLGTWYTFFPVEAAITPDEMADTFGRQAPIAFFKSIWDGKWKMPVYPTGTPGTHKYFLNQTGTAYKWKVGEDFIADSVQSGFTPVDEIINEIHVRFGYFAPTGAFRYESWVGPSGSDDGNGTRDQNAAAPDNRETYAADSKTDYGVKASITVDCPTTADFEVAKRLRNYIFDRFYRPRVVVTFTAGPRAIGIEPGMVTKIHNDLQDYIPCPWYPGPKFSSHRNWDDMQFFVRDVAFDYTGGAFLHTITLEEIPS